MQDMYLNAQNKGDFRIKGSFSSSTLLFAFPFASAW